MAGAAATAARPRPAAAAPIQSQPHRPVGDLPFRRRRRGPSVVQQLPVRIGRLHGHASRFQGLLERLDLPGQGLLRRREERLQVGADHFGLGLALAGPGDFAARGAAPVRGKADGQRQVPEFPPRSLPRRQTSRHGRRRLPLGPADRREIDRAARRLRRGSFRRANGPGPRFPTGPGPA